jgi:hypothetical protein
LRQAPDYAHQRRGAIVLVIVSDEQRRTMEFIAVVNRGGYRPTGREINQWRLAPGPKPARRGKLLEPEIPGSPDRRIRRRKPGATGLPAFIDSALKSQQIVDAATRPYLEAARKLAAYTESQRPDFTNMFGASQWGGLGLFDEWEYETIPGRPSKPAVYAPDKPAERFLAHLRRLGWIERDARGRYSVTKLGRALLAADASLASAEVDPAVVVLAPEDQNLGYGQVLGRVSTCGDALVADHYLGIQELMDLLEHTDASRFLIGPNMSRDRVTELIVQIKVAGPTALGVVRELRRAPFHDRYLVGEQNVFSLTASLNGVSKSSMALLVEMTDVAADAVRTHVEQLWNEAEPLARGLSPDDLTAGAADDEAVLGAEDETAVAQNARSIREEDGRFLHEGCKVRHRKRQAALNCTHGS